MTWQQLQELKVRALGHSKTYGFIGPQGNYWWAHYEKLCRLQSKLEPEEPLCWTLS